MGRIRHHQFPESLYVHSHPQVCSHTSCDGEGIGLKFADEYGELTLCNGMIKTENDVISCTIDIRVPVTLKSDEVRRMCESRLDDENGRIEILGIGDASSIPETRINSSALWIR